MHIIGSIGRGPTFRDCSINQGLWHHDRLEPAIASVPPSVVMLGRLGEQLSQRGSLLPPRFMRINTDGKYQWREGLYDDVGELLGEGTRSGAIDASCEFTREMLRNLEEAKDHPDMTEELAEVLSTRKVELEYEVRTGVRIDGKD